MSHAILLEDIRTELEQLDDAALQSIRQIIDRAKRPRFRAPEIGRRPTVPLIDLEEPLPFVGENLTPKEHERLSLKERGMLKMRLKERNQQWLQENFAARRAAWLVVIDGKIIASGRSLRNQPMQPQILKICRRTGKFPFVFINDDFLAIEENASTWHTTTTPKDFYPTVPITFSSDSGAVQIVGDFDTGSAHIFANYDFLIAQNVIQPQAGDDTGVSRHLSRSFLYVTKFLRFTLSAKSDLPRAAEAKVYCVLDWHASPFVNINPNRTALIGRDMMLELKPRVLLDFDKRQTEIVTAKKTAPARKKTVSKKKNTGTILPKERS